MDDQPSNHDDPFWNDFTKAHSDDPGTLDGFLPGIAGSAPAAPPAPMTDLTKLPFDTARPDAKNGLSPAVFPLTVPQPPEGVKPVPAPWEIDVDAMVRLVEQTQRVQSVILKDDRPRKPEWYEKPVAQTALWGMVTPTAMTMSAICAEALCGTVQSGMIGGLIAVGSLVLGVFGLDHKWTDKFLPFALGGTVGGAAFTMTATGDFGTGVLAWLMCAASSAGFKIWYDRKHAESKAEVELIKAKTRNERIKGDAAKTKAVAVDAMNALRIQQMQQQMLRDAMAAATPAATGATAEERALRAAVQEVFGVSLHSCDVRFTRTGWTATIGLPVALSRNDARNGWHKVGNAMRLNGRLKAAEGRRTNELDITFVDNEKIDTTPVTGWYPGASWAIAADTGDEIHVPLGRRMLFAGASGSGKSWSARPLMAEASEYSDHRLVLIDMKTTEARNWQHRARIAFEIDQIDEITEELTDEGERRLALIPRGRDVIEIGDEMPRITVFVDEGGELITAASEDIMDRFRTIARKYRAAEIILVWCTQKPSLTGHGHGLDSAISANLTHKLSMTVNTPSESRVVFGEDAGLKGWDAHELPMPGWALLRDIESQSEPSRLRMRAMSPKDVIALPDRPVWFPDGDRCYAGDSQYRELARAANSAGESLDARIKRLLAEQPGMSNRAMAAELGVNESTVRRALKGL